jgi:hypothetical protein
VPIKATRGNEFWAERTIGAANAAVALAAPKIKASRRLWKRFMGNLMNLHDLWKNEVKPSSRRSTDIRLHMLHLGWNNVAVTTRIIGIKVTLRNLDGLVVICSNPMSSNGLGYSATSSAPR